jgi:hypothetical protein
MECVLEKKKQQYQITRQQSHQGIENPFGGTDLRNLCILHVSTSVIAAAHHSLRRFVGRQVLLRQGSDIVHQIPEFICFHASAFGRHVAFSTLMM